MDFLGINQLAEKIKRDNINFIGCAFTPWHAHGIDSSIRYLQDRGVKINGIIWVQPTFRQSDICYIIDNNNFLTNCCKLYNKPAIYDTRFMQVLKSLFIDYKSVRWYKKQYEEKHENIIFLAAPWHVDYRTFAYLYQALGNSYGFRLILVEEGLSSYFPVIDTPRHVWNTLSANKRGFVLIRSCFLSLIQIILRKRFESSTQWINLNLLKGKAEELYPNPISINYYRKILIEFALKESSIKCLNLDHAIIICTMAYMRSEIKNNSDIYTLGQVVRELKKRKICVYIKPHPREKDYKVRYAALDCPYIDSPCTIESLIALSPSIRGIISFSSTSLITAKLFFNVECVSVLHFVKKDDYGKYIREEMESFIYCFRKIVKMPYNAEELGNYFND